jgi:cytochrome b
MNSAGTQIKVWDPLVRIFHWSLVAAVLTAWITEGHYLTVHVLAGHLVAALILFRLAWGLAGTRYARFSDFIFRPRVVLEYLRNLVRFRAPRYIGHGPAGGSMVIALMITLSLAVVSGLAVYGGKEFQGPLTALMAGAGDGWTEAAKGLHEFFAGLTVALVSLHVAGVLFSSFAHRENLIRSMWTGTKPPEPAVSHARFTKGEARMGIALMVLSMAFFTLAGPATARAAVVDDLLKGYRQQGAAAFDAAAGEAIWKRMIASPDSAEPRGCTSCHTADLRAAGKHVRTGKPIDPMSPSVNAKRLTDPKFIEKWFKRNCKWTLGRECTPTEKGNILLYIRGR